MNYRFSECTTDQWIFPFDTVICLIELDNDLLEFQKEVEKKGIKFQFEKKDNERVLLYISNEKEETRKKVLNYKDIEVLKKEFYEHFQKEIQEIHFYDSKDPFFEFSNFYERKIIIDKKEWISTEHYYQSNKYLDEELKEESRKLETPKEVFDFSRKNEKFVRKDWNEVKEDVMFKGIKNKFEQHLDLKEILLFTKEMILVEHSKVDFYWGDGYSNGKNRLGYLLMKLRKELK